MSSDARDQVKSFLMGFGEQDRRSLLAECGISTYPWYEVPTGDSLEQGDIIDNCPVYRPPDDLPDDPPAQATFSWTKRDAIVLTQSCDLVKGREKVEEILLCAVWNRSEFSGKHHLATPKGMEDARGNLPAFHVLAESTMPGLEREARVVEFSRVSTLPIGYFRKLATKAGQRLRLLPPYREHLSQAFARFFMRVGLPVDVPPFK